jgi:hypothetical protein
MAASTIPPLPFGLVARLSATHKRAQTVSGPPQSPTRSLEGSGSLNPGTSSPVREREREKFIDNQIDDCRSVSPSVLAVIYCVLACHRRWALVAQHWRRVLYWGDHCSGLTCLTAACQVMASSLNNTQLHLCTLGLPNVLTFSLSLSLALTHTHTPVDPDPVFLCVFGPRFWTRTAGDGADRGGCSIELCATIAHNSMLRLLRPGVCVLNEGRVT